MGKGGALKCKKTVFALYLLQFEFAESRFLKENGYQTIIRNQPKSMSGAISGRFFEIVMDFDKIDLLMCFLVGTKTGQNQQKTKLWAA